MSGKKQICVKDKIKMQTSSNFFNKSLFALDDQSRSHKKADKYLETHIVPDPLRLKDQLTPWTQINPKYNFNTQRLIKFKQKINQQQKLDNVETQQDEAKQIKPDMVSNLFNFYKNNKEKKRSTLNNAKRKSQNKRQNPDQTDNSWTLPSILDKEELEQDLVQKKQSLKKIPQSNQQIQKQQNKVKQGNTFIESISIRQYLMKLKQKQKVFSSPQIVQKTTGKDHLQKSQLQPFTSSRHAKAKPKGLLANSLSSIKEKGNDQVGYRYAPIRNPQSHSYKKRTFLSPLQSLQQSFQIYKKAAELQVQESLGNKKVLDKNQSKLNGMLLGDKPYWKNNVPLSSLVSSPSFQSTKKSDSIHESLSPVKKYNTISYDRSFSPTQHSVQLPRLGKNLSERR